MQNLHLCRSLLMSEASNWRVESLERRLRGHRNNCNRLMSLGMFRQSTVNQLLLLLLLPFHKTRRRTRGIRTGGRAEFDESLIHLPAEFIVNPDDHCRALPCQQSLTLFRRPSWRTILLLLLLPRFDDLSLTVAWVGNDAFSID